MQVALPCGSRLNVAQRVGVDAAVRCLLEVDVLVILGASARAAAFSALRAGLTPWCADLFADADLRRWATVRRVPVAEYPRGLLAALAQAPQGPVLYTGALENYPRLVAQLPGPMWGNPAHVLRRVRTPWLLEKRLRERGLPCPRVSVTPRHAGRWLLKPRGGAGGAGIRVHAGEAFASRQQYLQEWVEGEPHAGLFVGRRAGDAELLGVTRQLIGTTWLGAAPFRYAGSIGPLDLSPDTRSHWHQLGTALVASFGLRGLFGVDAIVRDGVPWPVEVNPRYTASVEIIERALAVPLLHRHRAAFVPADALPELPMATGVWGKAIVFARSDLVFPALGPWCEALAGASPDATLFADIPERGARIVAGAPVLTVFACAPDVAICTQRLRENVANLDLWLSGGYNQKE